MTAPHVAPVRIVPPALEPHRLRRTAVAAGVALGVVDLLLQLTLPYPLANLANSSAVWALAAFALAAAARTTPARSAAAGATMLVVAVPAYYLLAVLVQRADLARLVSPAVLTWMLFGLLAGSLFGVAGSWLRSADPWRAAAGLGAASAVFFAEAGLRLLHASALGDLATTMLTCALGTGVLLTAVARPDHLARAALLTVPLTALGMLAFSLGGF